MKSSTISQVADAIYDTQVTYTICGTQAIDDICDFTLNLNSKILLSLFFFFPSFLSPHNHLPPLSNHHLQPFSLSPHHKKHTHQHYITCLSLATYRRPSFSLHNDDSFFFLAKTFITGHHHHLHFIFRGILNTPSY